MYILCPRHPMAARNTALTGTRHRCEVLQRKRESDAMFYCFRVQEEEPPTPQYQPGNESHMHIRLDGTDWRVKKKIEDRLGMRSDGDCRWTTPTRQEFPSLLLGGWRSISEVKKGCCICSKWLGPNLRLLTGAIGVLREWFTASCHPWMGSTGTGRDPWIALDPLQVIMI
ncbi:hypothetical protein BDW62DRAFT_27977 [Aspergillus aurantiobrunneus]